MVNVQKQMQKQQKNYHLKKNKISKNSLKKKNAVLFIKSSFNNIITNIIFQKKMIFCRTCGTRQLTGCQRHGLFAMQNLVKSIKEKLNKLNIKTLTIYFKGVSYKNQYIIKQLYKYKFLIIKITNLTSVPHNGCKKPKKKRR